jgi:hypothetical protein
MWRALISGAVFAMAFATPSANDPPRSQIWIPGMTCKSRFYRQVGTLHTVCKH